MVLNFRKIFGSIRKFPENLNGLKLFLRSFDYFLKFRKIFENFRKCSKIIGKFRDVIATVLHGSQELESFGADV